MCSEDCCDVPPLNRSKLGSKLAENSYCAIVNARVPACTCAMHAGQMSSSLMRPLRRAAIAACVLSVTPSRVKIELV